MPVDKVIVTNVSALRRKYGSGLARVSAAIDRLVRADGKRGLESRLVALDSAEEMAEVGGAAVTDPADAGQAKAAVDAVWNAHQPDYLMILGAPDVVPMAPLANPVRGDGDPDVPSDLPYACAEGAVDDPLAFLGPTRVVGRLPDLVGATSPAYLVKLLGVAARHRSRARGDYERHFGLSAQVWEDSTALSLTNLFGTGASLQTSPPGGPRWRDAQLHLRAHFINCHGAPSDPAFYGQPAGRGEYPPAHEAARLEGKISDGAVIAAECCYGAQLYDPADTLGQPGICSAYLLDGAYGFFGSTTIAYGPSAGNGQADLVCQFFLDAVLKGASLGRAALEARQRFAALYSHLDPIDLKTLVQFYLLGDPSIHPVAAPAHGLAKTRAYRAAFEGAPHTPGARAYRRERLMRTGTNLRRTLGATRPTAGTGPGEVAEVLAAAARDARVEEIGRQAYEVAFPPTASEGEMKRLEAARRRRSVHVLLGRGRGTEGPRTPHVVAIAATLQDGRIAHLRRVHSR